MNKKNVAMGMSLLMLLGAFTVLSGSVAGDVSGNDSFVNAEAITPGPTKIAGTTTVTSDEADYYKFTLAAGQYFTVNYSVDGGTDDGKCVVAKKDQNYWRGSDWLSAGQSWSDKFTIGAADAGVYYVYTEGGDMAYNITVQVYDQNDGGQVGDAPADINSARTVAPGTFTGWVADEDLTDYYVFAVPAGNKINATLTVGNLPDATMKMTLYKPDKNTLMATSWINPGLFESLTHQTSDVTGGNYYMLLDGDTQNYTVSIVLTPENDSGSGTDVPGLIDNAYLIPGNGTYTGYLYDDDEADFYKFNITGGQIMTYTFTVGTMHTDTAKLTLYKPNKDSLQASSWLNPGLADVDGYTTNNAGGGVYYFGVSGANTYTIALTITMQNDANVSGDAGDTIDTARPILLNTNYTGFMLDMDDSDFYVFQGVTAQKVLVNFNNTVGADTIKATIYGTDKNSKKSSSWVNVGLMTQLEYTPDATGNQYIEISAANATYFFNVTSTVVDAIPPVIVITAPANGATLNASAVTVTGTASDNIGLAKVEVNLNGGAFGTAVGTTTWTFGLTLNNGTNTIVARATDIAGNTNTTQVVVTFSGTGPIVNDTTKPQGAITSPTSGKKVDKSKLALITGSATDNVGVTAFSLKLNGAELPASQVVWVPILGTFVAANVTLKEGKNTLVATATDAAGNSQSATTTITYEKPAPTPGFEVLLLVAALAFGTVLLGRKRK
jgi:hypothetical protein